MGASARFAEAADYDSAIEQLFARKPQGPTLGIDRMRRLAPLIGHPELRLPVIHVGGTNGKGSVCAMLESILRTAGWRVGLFTSPHLVEVGERVQVDRVPLTRRELMDFLHEFRPILERIEHETGADEAPTFFELMTGIGLLHFSRSRCDIAVIEVGMGGEFDATNIVSPEVSVLTSVSLDHCEWLGNTVEEIARTKAGIIKPHRPIVLGRLPAPAERVVRQIARKQAAQVHAVGDVFGDDVSAYPVTALPGEYQRWNAATASIAARVLSSRWKVTEVAIADGLAEVDWPGRWEKLTVAGRNVILDASHNPEGARVLEQNLARLVEGQTSRPYIVTGVLGTTRAEPLLRVIARAAQEVFLVAPNQPRATPTVALQLMLADHFSGPMHQCTVSELFPGPDQCSIGQPGDTVVVTGSIYLLGEVLGRLRRSPRGDQPR